jgi:hypothetical protein
LKIATTVGALLILLGVLSFVVPFPHSEDHSVKIGDAKIGVQTEHSEKIPAGASAAILVAGAVLVALGLRKSQ